MVKENAKKDRPQFNVTFKPKCEEEMELFTWLNTKLNPTSYIKEQLYMVMRLEQKGVLFNPDLTETMQKEPKEEDLQEEEPKEEPKKPEFDLDVDMEQMPEL